MVTDATDSRVLASYVFRKALKLRAKRVTSTRMKTFFDMIHLSAQGLTLNARGFRPTGRKHIGLIRSVSGLGEVYRKTYTTASEFVFIKREKDPAQ